MYSVLNKSRPYYRRIKKMKVIGERKAVARRLAELTGEAVVYTRMPSRRRKASPKTVCISVSGNTARLGTRGSSFETGEKASLRASYSMIPRVGDRKTPLFPSSLRYSTLPSRSRIKEHHLIKCFFQKLKWFRRIFTRYDKLDFSFLAFVYIGAIAILLK